IHRRLARGAPDRGPHRDRARDRAPAVRRARGGARRTRLRGSADERVPAVLAAPRRRRLHPRRSRGRGRLLPAALAQLAGGPAARDAAPRGPRHHGGDRRGGGGGVGGDRWNLHRARRRHRARAERRGAPRATVRAARRAGSPADAGAPRHAVSRASAGSAGAARVLMRDWLLNNWGLKVLAMAVAAVVWFFVVGADRSQIGFAAPIEYVGLEGMRVVLGTPRETAD